MFKIAGLNNSFTILPLPISLLSTDFYQFAKNIRIDCEFACVGFLDAKLKECSMFHNINPLDKSYIYFHAQTQAYGNGKTKWIQIQGMYVNHNVVSL